jgi:CRP-like cAMP-binding protein
MVYKRYFKGEKIFFQNSFYEGIYLIKSGEVKISVNISIDEMYNLITYLTFALNKYNDYVSGFTSKDYINDQIQQQNLRIKSHNGLDNEEGKLYAETKNYPLMIIKEYNILGTNESFDHQTEIYNFEAECISDEAILYFLPKENLNKIIKKEKMVYSSLIQLIEFRIKNIIWKVKNYIKLFENKMVKLKAKKMKTKKNILLNIENDNNDYKTNNVNITENNSVKNIINGLQKKMIISHNYSKSNIIQNIKYKNIFLSQENKNINFNDMIYSYRKTTNNNIMQSISYTPKIPKVINSVKKSRINEFNNTIKQFPSSQSKKNLRKCMPEKFPYLVMDLFSKREMLKDRKNNLFYHIKTSNNIQPLRIKRIYVNNN